MSAPNEVPDELDFPVDRDDAPGMRCEGCGCTDEFSCGTDGCYWVQPGLCSACAVEPEISGFHNHKIALPIYRTAPIPRRVA